MAQLREVLAMDHRRENHWIHICRESPRRIN